jgi:hypothetical protein
VSVGTFITLSMVDECFTMGRLLVSPSAAFPFGQRCVLIAAVRADLERADRGGVSRDRRAASLQLWEIAFRFWMLVSPERHCYLIERAIAPLVLHVSVRDCTGVGSAFRRSPRAPSFISNTVSASNTDGGSAAMATVEVNDKRGQVAHHAELWRAR